MSTAHGDAENAKRELARLTAPNVLGFHTHFEITEIFAIQGTNTVPVNIFSILVAEERTAPQNQHPIYLSKKLISLKTLKGWKFGITQYIRPITELAEAFDIFYQTGKWSLSGKELNIGPIFQAPTQFVPPNSTLESPWNNVLKNNFWSGSYIIEWVDPQKNIIQPFIDEPPRLQELSDAIQQYLPIKIASLSDRIGNILVQIPVTILISNFARSNINNDSIINIKWHPKSVPRPLRASCEIQFDNNISGYASADIYGSETSLPIAKGQGLQRGTLWDDQHQVILAATGSTGFINSAAFNMYISDPEPRCFSLKDKNGNEENIRIGTSTSRHSLVRSPDINQGEDWTSKRIYREETTKLARERRFVQYRPKPDSKEDEHNRALQDVRLLINNYGQKGAWLWDPYLSAEDILRTLFFCSHNGADLRALTAGSEPPSGLRIKPTFNSLIKHFREWIRAFFPYNSPPDPTYIEKQCAIFDSAKSNFHGLRLEYRVKTGQAGWAFHDRFLIFPDTEEGALAWSLGTSVNSVGKQHHILQKVDDGQLVMDAFNELWHQLDQPEHLVWKIA